MQLINFILHQNFTQLSHAGGQTATQSDSIYTLEDLVQTLEEVATYLGTLS